MNENPKRIAAEWFQRVGLAVVAVLVIENIFAGAEFTDRGLVAGIIATLIFYSYAFYLLFKSFES